MVFIVWEIFTREWIRRSERKGEFDDGDRFISLWIAFNGWMRGKYGEQLTDLELKKNAQIDNNLNVVFNELKTKSVIFQKQLNELSGYTVANMKYPHDETKMFRYNGSFTSLVEVIYSVRSNLFHGRKDISDDKKDLILVGLSYKILRELFVKYLEKHEPYCLPSWKPGNRV